MKKIVFCNIMMKKKLDKFVYPLDGEMLLDKEVSFPINTVLAKELQKGDEVQVVLMRKDDIEGNAVRNVSEFMLELNDINNAIGANINYKVIASQFDESKNTQEMQLRSMIDTLSENAEIYCDMTYGPKSLPIIMFSVLNFAEKHFNADLKYLVYGKVDFVDGKPCNPAMIDMTPLYYLNSITSAIESRNGEDAKKILDVVLAI